MIDRFAPSQLLVEGARQNLGGPIGDLLAHGNNGGNARLPEDLAGSRAATIITEATVQNDQPEPPYAAYQASHFSQV